MNEHAIPRDSNRSGATTLKIYQKRLVKNMMGKLTTILTEYLNYELRLSAYDINCARLFI